MIVNADVVVLGAGVSGLTCAIRLAEAGFRVTVHSADPPARITSYAAGAIWGCYLVAHDRGVDWSLRSLEIFRDLAREPAVTGVRMTSGVVASRGDLKADHPGPGAEDVQPVTSTATLPPGFTNGWWYRVPLIDMVVYLAYLTARLDDCGVRVQVGGRVTPEQLPRLGTTVVNCTGVDAGDVVPGDPVRPIRGDLLVVGNPGIDTFFVEHDDDRDGLTTYVLPHGDRVMLGGSRTDGDWSRQPDPERAEQILQRCVEAEPLLAGARVLDHRVGLRPARKRLRVEADGRHPHVIHNYGHGGAGVTLSWGCADEVLALTGAAARTTRRC
ncbi:FAD-dependent oxidoreductase [Actinoplanes sichuanensis]|uniref:D-amino-acid oxidase n=1 Tax=Actinoplanes sichuanensis TaxID=512349 RepID=A0ABW4A9F1_9ACTN|nr:FAD-dependent oxidoreductase [Actinoplanes sichuanensis]BEL09082.1 FAD-dependent oxidoreductase [Actinoplanes sichuanensis]